MHYYKELSDLDASDLIVTANRYLMKFHRNVLTETVRFFHFLDLENFTKYNPAFAEICNKLELTPNFVAALVMHFPKTDIHRDPQSGEMCSRLNIPLMNCEHSETRFFKMLPGKTGQLNIPESDCEQVASITLKHPTVFRIGQPHQVVMTDIVYPRISLTINFNEGLSSLINGADGED